VRWWLDADGDGYGDPEQEISACTAPEGYVAYLDCDDTNPEVHPGAEEWCSDGVDNDCDETIDEDRAADATTWYLDADEDGYGRPQDKVEACEQPSGYVHNDQDCDDDDPEQSPAATEVWYDGVDGDCNRGDDFDADGDGYRSEEAGVGDDCDDTESSVHPGAAEACGDGIDNDCDGDQLGACRIEGDLVLVDAADAVFRGLGSGDQLGSSITWLGDPDSDGQPNYAIGRSGGVYLLEGQPPDGDDLDPATHLAICAGVCAADGSGGSAAVAGDLDGDGIGDIWVLYNSAASGVFLVSGAVTATVDLSTDSVPSVSWDGEVLFHGISAGHDAGSDGVFDLAIAGINGPVYVVSAPTDEDLSIADADVRITQATPLDEFGRSVTWVGDMDGDGLPELAVGAPSAETGGSETGAVYLFRGGELTDGTADDLGEVLYSRSKSASLKNMAMSLADAGDTNGDGYSELLVGSAEDGVGLVQGLDSGTLPDDAIAWFGEGDRTRRPGLGVGSAGDVNGDELPDILIGDWRLETEFGSKRGGAMLFLAPFEGTYDTTDDAAAILVGESVDSRAGDAVHTIGDINGDGFADFLVGAYSQDNIGSQEGAVYFFLGGVD
jgi:hypothetical protein